MVDVFYAWKEAGKNMRHVIHQGLQIATLQARSQGFLFFLVLKAGLICFLLFFVVQKELCFGVLRVILGCFRRFLKTTRCFGLLQAWKVWLKAKRRKARSDLGLLPTAVSRTLFLGDAFSLGFEGLSWMFIIHRKKNTEDV